MLQPDNMQILLEEAKARGSCCVQDKLVNAGCTAQQKLQKHAKQMTRLQQHSNLEPSDLAHMAIVYYHPNMESGPEERDGAGDDCTDLLSSAHRLTTPHSATPLARTGSILRQGAWGGAVDNVRGLHQPSIGGGAIGQGSLQIRHKMSAIFDDE